MINRKALTHYVFLSAAVILIGCLNPVRGHASAPAPKSNRIVVWDGEKANVGAGWTNPTSSTLKPQNTTAHSGKTALEFKFKGSKVWLGAGWNWFRWKPGFNIGTDTSGMKNLTFWVKSKGKTGDLQINLVCNGVILDTPEEHTEKVRVLKYCPKLLDGMWHEVVVPLADLKQPKGYRPKIVSQIQLGLYVDNPVDGSFFIDDIAFDKRK